MTQTTQTTKLSVGTKVTIGIAIATVVALGVTFGFAVYLGGFANYPKRLKKRPSQYWGGRFG